MSQRTLKLVIEYDGTEFAGWQIQPNQRTVQDVIEQGLLALTGHRIRITGSGRTDSGVHALGQVASFITDSHLPLKAFHQGLNTLIPRDVQIVSVHEAHSGFDARRSAVLRTYRYRLFTRPRALERQYGWCPRQAPSLSRMRAAASSFIGRHDWTSFCRKTPDIPFPVSTVTHAAWTEGEDEYRFEISAHAFFHNMVRIMVGTMVEVGINRREPGDIPAIIKARNRDAAGPTAPPSGLALLRVDYPEGEGIALDVSEYQNGNQGETEK